MKADAASSDSLEILLAKLLHHGTMAASGLIALGMALSLASGPLGLGLGLGTGVDMGMRIATAGIALFILLPALRVATMLIFFLRARDYRYGAIAGLVLLIISISFFVGTRWFGTQALTFPAPCGAGQKAARCLLSGFDG
jgi:hypothetical protein